MFKKINNQHLNFENALIIRNISKGAKLGKMLKSAFFVGLNPITEAGRSRSEGEREKRRKGERERL